LKERIEVSILLLSLEKLLLVPYILPLFIFYLLFSLISLLLSLISLLLSLLIVVQGGRGWCEGSIECFSSLKLSAYNTILK
jgi:hypothetical protein